MKIVGISGSPKPAGFTNLLLKNAMEGARSAGAETEIIMLSRLKFSPCQECMACVKTGECALPDEMQPVYKKMLSADGLIIASPIYFGTVSAQLKAMIDRLECLWNAKYLLKRKTAGPIAKRGAFICVAGEDKREYFESAKKVVRMAFATIDMEYAGELFAGGLSYLKTDSPEREAYIEIAFRLGASLASP